MIKKFHEKELDEIYVEGSNKEVFSGKLLHVQMDTVKLPSGSTATREYIRHPGAVAIVPVLDDGSIILVKQCRYPLDTVMWEIPAGKLDHGPDEDILECAKRELSEETGYSASKWQELIAIATTPGFSDEVIYLFKAEGLTSGEQHPDEDEFVAVASFTPEEIKRMLKSGELYDSKTICALYACELLK
ncbi:MAG: NUDIX hydrolase [Phascolarctobacterium sp.]|nr:NUDIX hydrolase [Phascolarctobacterium sp.]